MRKLHTLFTTIFLLACMALSGQELDMSKLNALKFRNIGPAGMSGRVTSIDVVERNKAEIYIGTATGGVWKSENGGINFKPMFNGAKVASIGDISIYQKNPNIIYVGTGEGNPRNSQSSGNGMYKSIDGGKTWKHLGLNDSRNIHRVIVHPDNPDVVYAGVQGPAWAPTTERGVYKSVDGGESWKQILSVNDTTGVAEMVMDPQNPNKLIVAMWQFQRWPYFFKSGGKGSGIHVTMDGGETWAPRVAANGLPKGEWGRIGLAISASSPNVVYALVESEKTALYRSDNGGLSFRMTSDKVGDRPFYYAEIYVDPQNENRVYSLATQTTVSEDGGKNFRPLMGMFSVHSDHHAFWIDPDNPKNILDGNDGGLYSSTDGGKSWRFHHNLPLGQFYHIRVDNEIPYNVLGGLQDNGSWSGPAYKWQLLGNIGNSDFQSVGFGDGFDVIPDPDDNRYGYSTFQGGMFMRYDKQAGLISIIKPADPDDTKLRFNWNSAMAIDPFDPSTIYVGSQFVHKSQDKGNSWEIISPDLTTNDPEKQKQYESGGLTIDNSTAENFTTLTVIEPSPLEKDVIWAGSDDGNVQISRDGGKNWTNVVGNIRELAQGSWVAQIKASTHREGEAFVVFDDHRRNNWSPYLFKTSNYGKSWKRMTNIGDVWGYTLSVAQDPDEENLIFLGTEFGLYVSINGGESWTKWKSDFPTTSAMDMVIHPREHDLVVGTFGRSVWILDDIRPLREMASMGKKMADTELHMFSPPDAYQAALGFPSFFSGSNDVFAGQNRAPGAMLSFWSKTASAKDSTFITIKDAQGEVVRELKTTTMPGVNRLAWDMKKEAARFPGPPDPFASFFSSGTEILPGDYLVEVKIGENVTSQNLKVLSDPHMSISMEEFKTQLSLKDRYQTAIGKATEQFNRMDKATKGLGKLMAFLKGREDEEAGKILGAAKELQEKMMMLNGKIMAKPQKGIVGDTDDLIGRLKGIGTYFFSAMVRPSESQEKALSKVEKQLSEVTTEIDSFLKGDFKTFQDMVRSSALEIMPE
ncbi:MAG: hypothetical protein R8P61_28510 [Bacteroidia bacterium]|nr:hypothetical protein [Bacteroidia bacterium]